MSDSDFVADDSDSDFQDEDKAGRTDKWQDDEVVRDSDAEEERQHRKRKRPQAIQSAARSAAPAAKRIRRAPVAPRVEDYTPQWTQRRGGGAVSTAASAFAPGKIKLRDYFANSKKTPSLLNIFGYKGATIVPERSRQRDRESNQEEALDSSFIDDGSPVEVSSSEEEDLIIRRRPRRLRKGAITASRSSADSLLPNSSPKNSDIRLLSEEDEKDDLEVVTASNGQKAKHDDDVSFEGESWICKSCTFLNYSQLPECEMCQTARPSDEREPTSAKPPVQVAKATTRQPKATIESGRKEKKKDISEAEENEASEEEGENDNEEDADTSTELTELSGVMEKCEECACRLRENIVRMQSAVKGTDLLHTESDAEYDEGSTVVRPPKSLQHKLMGYQLLGLNWLYLLHNLNLNGILADEMGLGKTIQTISLFALLKAKGVNGPHLVVVPATTLSNWERELEKWCPALKVLVYYGNLKERRDLRIKAKSKANDHYNVWLTTYNVAQGKHDRSFFRKTEFCYLVLDEAQHIKNVDSLRHKRLFHLRAGHRLLLTGTPLQNNLDEVLALLYFLLPRIFGNSEEFKSLRQQIAQAHKRSSAEGATGHYDPEQDYVVRIKRILEPFILRRLKSEVSLELGPKKEAIVECGMAELQQELYEQLSARSQRMWERYVASKNKAKVANGDDDDDDKDDNDNDNDGEQGDEENGDDEVVDLEDEDVKLLWVDEAEPDGRGTTRRGKKQITNAKRPKIYNLLNNILMQLRKMANHPLLCRSFYRDETVLLIAKLLLKKEAGEWGYPSLPQLREDLALYSDFELHRLALSRPFLREHILTPQQLFESSGKCLELQRQLEQLHSRGRRVLVFSQMTRMLDILETFMSHLGYQWVRLDGSTPVAERQELIDRFNEERHIFVFLLSTRAGGLGINLTSADTVLFYDISFNPQVDRQAEDRAHRLGQEKDVEVLRLITSGTIDEHILRMSEQKKRLSEVMLAEGSYAHTNGRPTPGPATTANDDEEGAKGPQEAPSMRDLLRVLADAVAAVPPSPGPRNEAADTGKRRDKGKEIPHIRKGKEERKQQRRKTKRPNKTNKKLVVIDLDEESEGEVQIEKPRPEQDLELEEQDDDSDSEGRSDHGTTHKLSTGKRQKPKTSSPTGRGMAIAGALSTTPLVQGRTTPTLLSQGPHKVHPGKENAQAAAPPTAKSSHSNNSKGAGTTAAAKRDKDDTRRSRNHKLPTTNHNGYHKEAIELVDSEETASAEAAESTCKEGNLIARERIAHTSVPASQRRLEDFKRKYALPSASHKLSTKLD